MKAHGLGFVMFFSVAIALRADAGEVRASEFGWNAEDATDALQAAIDSGAERVVVDRQKGDWLVRPVFLRRSNQEIVVDVPAEKALVFVGIDGTGIAPGGVKGSFTLERPGCAAEPLDLEAFAKRHPSNPEKFAAMLAFKTREVDWRGIAAQAGAQPLERPASTGWLRGRFTFVQAFPAAGEYPVVFRTRRLGKRRAFSKVQMRDAAGTDLGLFTVGDCATVTNVIRARGAGIRRFEISGGLTAVESRWPGQGVLADYGVPLYGGRNRRFYFTVPADAESVSVQVNPAERCSAKLMRPDGTVVAEAPYDKKQMSVLTAPREKTAAPEVWSVVFPRVEEDARFRVGAPALPVVATGSPKMSPALR